MKKKFMSRKFLMCLANVLLGMGATVTGMCIENETVTILGAILTAVGTGIYTFCEAMVDKAAVGTGSATESPELTEEEIEASII